MNSINHTLFVLYKNGSNMTPCRHTLFSVFDENRLKSLNMCTSYLAMIHDALKYFNGTILNSMHSTLRGTINYYSLSE